MSAPGCALRVGAVVLRTLFFQRLDEPGHGGQRLLGEGGVLRELCLPGESCGGKNGRRGLEIPACRNSRLFPQLPQDRIKLLLWHSHNQRFGSFVSNFGALLPLFYPLFAVRVTVGGSAACCDAKTCSGMCPARGEHSILGMGILQAKTPSPPPFPWH